MSRRRASSSSSESPLSALSVQGFTQDEINQLILKLQTLLPHNYSSSSSCNPRVASESKVLKEICNYIKKLQKEVDGLSERLSQLLGSRDITAIDEDIIFRRLLLQTPPN